ncbi:MAG: alpha/beta hydrolase [Bacteroidota bacterium]|nr:alpha/beta hydrolase [Bacteroidota bacterium]
MKKNLTFLILFTSVLSVFAQQKEYVLKENIPYYEGSLNQQDEYQKEKCALDIYYPKNGGSFSTVVWFHGGGLTEGNKGIPEELKNKGVCVVSVGYRLSPKVKCPAYIEDAAAAVAWVFRHIQGYGGDPNQIFVSGHSAGGYLTLMIGMDKKWLNAYGIDANKIAALIPFSGQTITHFTIRKERGIPETQPVVDEYAPLYHVRRDLPPLLLITGDREMELLGRYEENAYLMRMMKIAGHKQTVLYELDGYDHGGMATPAFPLLLKYMDKIARQAGISK